MKGDFLSLKWIFLISLVGSLSGGLVSFILYYFRSQKEPTDAILLALVVAISLFIGGFIGFYLTQSLVMRFRIKP